MTPHTTSALGNTLTHTHSHRHTHTPATPCPEDKTHTTHMQHPMHDLCDYIFSGQPYCCCSNDNNLSQSFGTEAIRLQFWKQMLSDIWVLNYLFNIVTHKHTLQQRLSDTSVETIRWRLSGCFSGLVPWYVFSEINCLFSFALPLWTGPLALGGSWPSEAPGQLLSNLLLLQIILQGKKTTSETP